MENTNEIMETIEATKENAIEAAQESESSVGKVVLFTIAGATIIAGAGYGAYKFITDRKAKKALSDEAFQDETVDEDASVEE